MTPLAAVCGLVLYAGFALRGANSSITPYSESTTLNSSYYDSPSSANSVAFPNCSGTTSWIQDGGCDDANNNAVCMFMISSVYYFLQGPSTSDHSHVFTVFV